MVEYCHNQLPVFSRVLTTVCLTTLFQFAACAQTNNEWSAPQSQAGAPVGVAAVIEEAMICEPNVALQQPPVAAIAIAEPSPESKLAAVKFSEPETKHAHAPRQFKATAYSIHGRTRSGARTAPGTMAADPRVLPLGTVVQVNAGKYSGVYTVHDTGGAIKGNRVDVWLPSNKEARRFGRRAIKLVVLKYPGQNAPTK